MNNSYSFNYCQDVYGESQDNKPTLTELTSYREPQQQLQSVFVPVTEYAVTNYYAYDPYRYNPNIIRAEQVYSNYINSFGEMPPSVEQTYSLEEDATAPVMNPVEEPEMSLRNRKRKQVNFDEDSGDEEVETRKSAKRKWKASSIAHIDASGGIDTVRLTNEVNATMYRLKIPQTQFAMRVLKRSQGTLSDLLKRPKPWDTLQPRGKHTYEMMRQWLLLSDHEKLAAAGVDQPYFPAAERKMSPCKASRKRLAFTPVQRRVLEAMFEKDNYPSEEMQQIIANKLRVDVSTVKNFMQNRRNRGKRELTRGKKNSDDWD